MAGPRAGWQARAWCASPRPKRATRTTAKERAKIALTATKRFVSPRPVWMRNHRALSGRLESSERSSHVEQNGKSAYPNEKEECSKEQIAANIAKIGFTKSPKPLAS